MTAEGSTKEIDQIGRYRVTGELGRGGMGVVYKGEDRQIGRRVAIKTLTDVTPELRERFYIEARSGILSHQNIVTVYEVGEHAGRPFMAMEFVEGDSLEKVLHQRKRLPVLEALSLVAQICAGLGHAHGHGVVHRDVKPANVLVRPDGRVTIVDFGIARLADQTRHLTKTDTLLGTFHYIAPERLKGEASDGRADLWSVGVMLYEMVTGALPFKGSDISSVYRVIHEPYVPIAEHVHDLPEGLTRVLDKALAKQVEHRYANADEMAFDVHLLAKSLKGQDNDATVDNGRTALLQTPRAEQQKVQRGGDSDETQQILQTIPLALVKDGHEMSVSANGDDKEAGFVEVTPRKQAKLKGQDSADRQSLGLAEPEPANSSRPTKKPEIEDRPKARTHKPEVEDRSQESSAGLKAEQPKAMEIHKAVEEAVAACNKAIAANHLDSCMRSLDDVARQYGENPLLATAREVCDSQRSERATQLLREAMRAARLRLRGGYPRDAERALKENEYAVPFADASAVDEWRRLKDECSAAPLARKPDAARAATAKRGKARWYAAGLFVIAALAIAAISYRRHEVNAAPKNADVHVPAAPLVQTNPIPTDMEINASPWARVVSIRDERDVSLPLPDGDHTTPLRLDALKSGKYKITFAGADGNQQTVECNVSAEEHLCAADFGSPDPDQLLSGRQP